MKVKELIKQLRQLNPNDDIVITALDDYFVCNKFEVRSNHDEEYAQEIIMNVYIDEYDIGETND